MISLGVSVTDRDGIRHVVLDRADKKNALTVAMYAALADAIVSASKDDVGAVLISARGNAFTAGNDLRDFLDQPPHGDDAPAFHFLQGLMCTDVPIVAAVRGAAVGIGTTMYDNEPDPGGLHYAYHRLVCGDWWDEDPYSSTYNRFVHVACGVSRVLPAGLTRCGPRPSRIPTSRSFTSTCTRSTAA